MQKILSLKFYSKIYKKKKKNSDFTKILAMQQL